MSDTVNIIGVDGMVIPVAADQVPRMLARGYKVETPEQSSERAVDENKQEFYNSPGQVARTVGYGLARGASLGLSDLALVGADIASPEDLRSQKKYHPGISTGAEIVGAVAPALLSGGSSAGASGARATESLGAKILGSTPAGLASRAERAITGLGAESGVLTKVAAAGAGGAAEGAANTAGGYLSDVALGKKDLSAEAFVASMGSGALWGLGIGGGAAIAEKGLIAARRMFPTHEVTKESVDAAEQTFLQKVDEAATADVDLVKTARQRLDEIKLETAQTGLDRARGDLATRQRLDALKVEKAETRQAIDLARLERQRLSLDRAKTRGAKGVRAADDVAPTPGEADDALADLTAPPPAPRPDAIPDEAAGDLVPSTPAPPPADIVPVQTGPPAGAAIEKAGLEFRASDSNELVSNNTAIFYLRDADRRTAGSMSVRSIGEGRYGIEYAELKDGVPQRQGIGTDFYVKANEWLAANKGGRLASDISRTDAAEATWKSMERKGLARRLPDEPFTAEQLEQIAESVAGDSIPRGYRYEMVPPATAGGSAIERAGLTVAPVDSDDLVLFTVRGKDGKRVGSLDVHRLDDVRYEVQGIELDDAFQRKGIGTELYDQASTWLAQSKGAQLVSDLNRTDAAEAAWASMVRKGQARKLPAERTVTDEMLAAAKRTDDSTPRAFRYEMVRKPAGGGVVAKAPLPAEMPAGFKKLTTRQNVKVDGRWTSQEVPVPVKTELPTHATIDEDIVYVSRPSDVAKLDLWGDEIRPKDITSVRASWGDEASLAKLDPDRAAEHAGTMSRLRSTGEIAELRPIDIKVTPGGRYVIEDGNHRLLAAAQMGDRPVAIRFRAMGPDWKPRYGRENVQERIAKAIPSSDAGDGASFAERQLTDALAATKAKLDAGESIGGMARREQAHADEIAAAVSDEAERVLRAAQDFQSAKDRAAAFIAKYRRPGVSNVGSFSGRRPFGPVATDRIVKPSSLADEILASADDVPLGAPIDLSAGAMRPFDEFEAARHAEDLAGFRRSEELARFRGGGGDGVAELGQMADRVAARGPGAAPQTAAAPQAAASPHAGRLTEEAAEAVKVFSDYERSHAELVEALGPAAPPSAQAQAKAYADAVAAQNDNLAAATARAADDAHIAAQVRAVDPARAAKAAATVLPAAPGALPAAAARAAAGSGLGKAADVAGMFELLQTMGDIPGVPDARDIPVIGPVLAMYLKWRGMKGIYSRLGGKIPASAEAKVASKAAGTRDRAAKAVDAALGIGAKVAARAGGASIPAALEVLQSPLFDDKEQPRRRPSTAPAGPKPSTTNEALLARVDELARAAANPDAVRSTVRRQVPMSNATVQGAIESVVLRKLAFLHKKAPKDPRPPSILRRLQWTPDPVAVDQFARYVRAAEDPMTVLDDLAHDRITPEAAEALRVIYPEMFGEVQARLLERAAMVDGDLPYTRRVQLAQLFDVPIEHTTAPEYMAFLQGAFADSAADDAAAAAAGAPPGAPGAPPPTPSIAGEVRLSQAYQTADQRRAAR